ncbi:hypothetical protein BDZ91DRAFT_751464 [Kalaharituber pfeilii]|nr:hypothetical protein BDZ91DRAFT_751464 [Kalaharituber pfeilii]
MAAMRAWPFTMPFLFLLQLVVSPLLIAADLIFVEPSATYLPPAAPPHCIDVLTRNITTCDSSIKGPNLGGSYTLDSLTNTDPLGAYAELALYNFNTTCVQTAGCNPQYCQLVLQQLRNSTALDSFNATDPRCSECYVRMYQARLNGGVWGGYSEAKAAAYSHLLESCSIPAARYPITYNPPPPCATATATTTTVAPNDTNPTPVPRCVNATYTVGPDDTCASIARTNSVATDALLGVNQLDAACRGLAPGSKLCMPPPCMTRLVGANDTCEGILGELGFEIDSLPRLVSWNVAINNQCSNLAGMVGKYICVTPPGTTTMPAPDPSLPQVTEAPLPPNAHPESNTYCAHWHTVTGEDTCGRLSIKYNIRLKDFYFLNRNLTSGCLNLMTGVAYCVKPVGAVNTYPGYYPYTQAIDFTQTIDLNNPTPPVNYTKTYRFTEPFSGPPQSTTSESAPDYANMTATYTLCPPWEEMPFNTTEYEDGELPEAVYENEEWMSEFSRVCLPDWTQPLPTKPPDFPPPGPDDGGEVTTPTPTETQATTTTTTTTTTITTTTRTTKTVCPTAPGPTPPGPTREGMAEDCVKFHIAMEGETCCDIAVAADISPDDFYAWNPAVGPDCAGLWVDYAYCVSVRDKMRQVTLGGGR